MLRITPALAKRKAQLIVTELDDAAGIGGKAICAANQYVKQERLAKRTRAECPCPVPGYAGVQTKDKLQATQTRSVGDTD
jgi:hypothetical protein